MPTHINPNDPDCKAAAAEILRRHNEGQPEANITTAVRDFLTLTGLAKPEHIVEENPLYCVFMAGTLKWGICGYCGPS